MLAVLVAVPTVMQNSLHTISTSSITAACHLLGYMVQGKITTGRCTDSAAGRHPVLNVGAPTSIIPLIFTPNALSAATLPIYPGLGQAPNNAGLVYPVALWCNKYEGCSISKLQNDNMAALPLKSPQTVQRAVVRFLRAKGHNAHAIHGEMPDEENVGWIQICLRY